MTEPTKIRITVRGIFTEAIGANGRQWRYPPAGSRPLQVEAWDAGNRYYNFERNGTTWQVRDSKVTLGWEEHERHYQESGIDAVNDDLTELPGYVFIPAAVVDDVRARAVPILARSITGDWWVVYRNDRERGVVDTMPEDEWMQVGASVLRAWTPEQGIIHATA